MSPQSSRFKNKPSKKLTEFFLPPASTLAPWLAYFSTLKMEGICSSEMSVDFQQNTCRYMPEDRTLFKYVDYL
jgi:hypothetical protein